jgi:hypothetical protein
MRLGAALFLSCVVALPATAQPLPRVKGTITAFDGLTFQLKPETGGAQIAVRLQPHTQFMTTEPRPLSAFKTGSWAAARVLVQDGTLVAEDLQLYPDGLRGSGEGRLAAGPDRFVIGGAVTASSGNAITLFYRGGRMAGGACLDRPDPARTSPVCTADPSIQVPGTAQVRALVQGDRRLLVVGAIATVSIAADAKGVRSTPGLILEKPQTSK